MTRLFQTLLIVFGLLALTEASAQLVVDNTLTPEQLVEDILLGQGVVASNITFTGTNVQRAYFDGSNSNVGLPEGVILSSGNVNTAIGPNNLGGAGTGVGGAGDPDLELLSGVTSFDAAILEFDFVPTGDSINFGYVFGSEEYNEYVCGTVNDVFGFFLSGPGFAGPYTDGAENIALIPGTTTPVSINTVNNGTVGTNGTESNCSDIDPNWADYNVYFTDNAGGASIQYDGFTTVLQARAEVVCGETYHIKMAISDGGDGIFDSGVFLEARSFSSNSVAVEIQTASGSVEEGGGWIVESCTPASITFERPAELTDTTLAVPVILTGSAENGIDYSGIPDTVMFGIGDTTVTVEIQALQDAIIEGPDSIIVTVYTVNICGDTVESTGVIQILDFGPDYPAMAPDDFTWCSTDSVLLTASAEMGNPGYTFNWTNGDVGEEIWVQPLTDTAFVVQAIDACGTPSIRDTVNITIDIMELSTSNDVLLDCPGDNATLTAIATGGIPSYTYVWSNGATGSNITVQPTETTDYIVSASDNCPEGSLRQDTITVVVETYSPLSIAVTDTSVLCPGDLATVTSDLTGGNDPFSYSWSSGSNGSTETLNPNATTDITLTVTDDCGETASDVATVTVPVYDALSAIIANQDLIDGDTITICEFWADTATSIVSGGLAPYDYTWSGTLIEGASVNNDSAIMVVNYELPPDSSVYELYSLRIVDQCMEEVTAEFHVEVISCDVISSNVFNPNSDFAGTTDFCGNTPQNNVFNLPCLELYPGNEMTIWDRWGRKLYKTENYHLAPWDGGNQATGTYFYVCELPGGNDPIKGYFQLVR